MKNSFLPKAQTQNFTDSPGWGAIEELVFKQESAKRRAQEKVSKKEIKKA